MQKKGDVAWGVVITVISVIIAGAVLVIFIINANKPEQYDRESCLRSVQMRSIEILETKVAKVPLKCKTQYINITYADENYIKETIANAMYDCWWQFDRGTRDFLDQRYLKAIGIGETKPVCMICSVIHFNDNVKNRIATVDITKYLEEKVPGQNYTYLDFFMDSEETKFPTGQKIEEIDTKEDYAVIFMGVKGDSIKEAAKDLLDINLLVIGGTTAVGGIKGLFYLVKGVALHPELLLLELIPAGIRGYFVWKNTRYANIYCKDLTVEKDVGCYALILAPFTEDTLTQYCQRIESIP